MREFLPMCGVREGGTYMRRAASSSGRLRLPHHWNPAYSRFLRRRRNDREFDPDGGSRLCTLVPENASLMLPQDALTRIQSKAGECLVFVSSQLSFSVVAGFAFVPGFGEAGVGDRDDREALLAFHGNRESSGLLAYGVENVVDNLYADLEQLVGISVDQQQVLWKFSAHRDFETVPLRLREFDGGAQQGVEIDGRHCG